MKTEDYIGRHGWSVLVFPEGRCIQKQGEITSDTAPKDEHLTQALYTCFVAGTINIILLFFQHYKYYLILSASFLHLFSWGQWNEMISYISVGQFNTTCKNNAIKLKNIESDLPPSMSLSSFQDDIVIQFYNIELTAALN